MFQEVKQTAERANVKDFVVGPDPGRGVLRQGHEIGRPDLRDQRHAHVRSRRESPVLGAQPVQQALSVARLAPGGRSSSGADRPATSAISAGTTAPS